MAPPRLTKLELAIMETLWTGGPRSVQLTARISF